MDNYIFIVEFNMPYGKKSIYEGSPSWMEQRMKLFTTYTLPSLNSQIDKEFFAFLLCDPDTPSPYKEQLLEIENKFSFVKIFWTKTQLSPEQYKDFLDLYKQYRKNNSNIIYASVCDNDDLIHKYYVKIAKEFYNQIKEDCNVACYAKGIYWDIDSNQFLDSYFPTNSFFTCKSTLDNFLNPRYTNHHDVVVNNNSIIIPTETPMWIQIVHGENLWNRLDRMPGELCQFNINDLKEHFGF